MLDKWHTLFFIVSISLLALQNGSQLQSSIIITMIDLHQSLISFLFHLLEHLFIIWQTTIVYYLSHLTLYPSTNHTVYRVLLTLNYAFLLLLLHIWMDLRMKSQLFYRFLIFDFGRPFISFLLHWFLFCHFVKNLWSSTSSLSIQNHFFHTCIMIITILRILKKLIVTPLHQTSILPIFTFGSTCH